MPPIPLGPSASWLLENMPFQAQSPFAPAGFTPATQQGWLTQMQGLGAQYGPAQQYANQMQGLQGLGAGSFLGGLGSGAFAGNPLMAGAAGAAGNLMGQYGGGFSSGLANQINRTGGSFDPFYNPALEGAIGAANEQLGRDFRQQVMPELNRAAIGAGPGAYGGTRAGVAQGLAEQGLADAMSRQTAQMRNQAYEAGLGRYVQDRGQTLDATLRAMQQGGTLGMQGARLLGDLGLGGLQQQNAMYQFGFGNMLPAHLQQAYTAGLQPGMQMGQMGQMMERMGGMQQMRNQQMLDWYNNQANQRGAWPWQQLERYQQAISPITGVAGTQGQTTGPVPYQNPFALAGQGAAAGYGLWNMFNQGGAGNNTGGGLLGAQIPPPGPNDPWS